MAEEKKIKLSKEEKEKIVASIQQFFLDNRDEEISDLQAGMLANLLAEEWGRAIYNQALADALKWFKEKMEYLEGDFYSLEK